MTNATYATLGLAGISFVGTFFVAPRFKDSFKEDVDWRDIYKYLAASGVKQVDAAEAYAKSKSGQAVLVDVRLGGKYEASHAAASVSLPLYLPIQNWDVASVIRRAGFAFFGIYGTELNTNFAAEVQELVPKGRRIIVLCESGGSLENKSGTKFGFQSRSLKAVYYLQKAGITQVSYVKGGLPIWAREGYPMASGPQDLSAVPGLQPDAAVDEESEGSGKGGFGLKLPAGLKLPQLSFGPAARR